MSERHFIIGTAGHIDHGKSSLIEALTGTHPDRLPEEKARGMTIELGFAQITIPSPSNPGASLHLGVIDVPGHADFVKNMVAGVGSLDLALFIVAADDGWMPQTEEHCQILQYLGVEHAIVVLTKIDIAEDLDLALEDVRENLRGGPWQNAPIVPVSSHSGEGLDQLRRQLAEILDARPPGKDAGKPRLPVDRAFSLKGVGTVATGTLINGSLSVGSEVVIQPSGATAHIRAAQSHNHSVPTAGPGMRTALNLSGVGVRDPKSAGKQVVGRGDIITLPDLGKPVLALDALIFRSGRGMLGVKPASRPLRTGREVMFHHGSASCRARIHFRDVRHLEAGQSALAEIRFHEPVFVFVGDRFVLRDASLGATLAGGTVLDEDANRRAFRKDFQGAFLEARKDQVHDLEVLLRSQLVRDKAGRLPMLLAKTVYSREEILEKALELEREGFLVRHGEWVFESAWWKEISRAATQSIAQSHREHPDQLGLPLRDLRSILAPELPSPKFFDVLVSGLLAAGYVKSGANIRHRDHIPRLPPDLLQAGERVRQRLHADLINPPNKGETAATPAEEKALRFLTLTGEVIDLDAKTVISREGYDLIKSQIIAYLRQHTKATASELRQHTNTVRRILMPLLELLDSENVTRREGDHRSLKSGPTGGPE